MTSAEQATQSAWEQWCLEEFLLEPGSRGAVDCIEITDEDLLDFVGTDDLIEASRSFAASLGRQASLRRIFMGVDQPPMLGEEPFFVRILIFACWVQVTSLREMGHREFRGLLSERLGWDVPSELRGLPPMWRGLRAWLRTRWNVDLLLPDPGSHKQIGYTVRLPFPTWRDLDVLRNVRDALPARHLEARLVVAGRVRTDGSGEKRTPAFSRRFQEWEHAVRIADPSLRRFAFDRAWMRIVAEKIGASDVVVTEDDFGDLRLSIIDVRGAVRDAPFLGNEEIAGLKPSIGDAARKGLVWMATAGFGRWVSTESWKNAAGQLVSGGILGSSGRHNSSEPIPVGSSGWLLMKGAAPARPSEALESRAAGSAARRTDGIRIGAALLGRAPMTPSYAVTGDGAFVLEVGGGKVRPTRRAELLGFPDGVWEGEARLLGDELVLDSVRLVPDALEHPEGSLKTYDESFAVPEDGPLLGTEPTGGLLVVAPYGGPKREHVGRMLALEEAVYARCRRSLALGDLARLAARATEDLPDAPSPWDVLRAFIDGGWLEPAATRKAAGRLLVPRAPCFREAREGERRLFLLDGAAAGAVRRRILACADAVGLEAQEVHGVDGWSPPLVVVHVGEDAGAEAELLSRTGLKARTGTAAVSPPSTRWKATGSTLGYVTSGVWNRDEARFDGGVFDNGVPTDTGGPALTKMDRPRLDQPPLYVVRHGPDQEILLSPVLALLRHAELARVFPYVQSGGLLLRSLRRHYLPAAWGRWLSLRALAPAGPFRTGQGWTYAYPADAGAVRALARLCRVTGRRKAPAWIGAIAASGRADLPSIAHSGTILRPRVGRSDRA